MKYRTMIQQTGLAVLAMGAALMLSACGEKQKPDMRGELTITTNPTEADFHLVNTGKDIGTTPKTGKFPPGTYIFRFSKPNYETSWEKVTVVAGAKKTLEFKLEPISASVMIKSVPKGAKIEFNGKVIGVTPHTIRDLPVGRYTAILSIPAFSPKEISWNVTNSRPILLTPDLIPNVGTLQVDSEPSNAVIAINGEPKGNTPFKERLEQGQHKVSITKDGYMPFEQIVTVTRDKKTDINAKLEVMLSTMAISSTPSGATINVNGKPYGNTPFVLKGLQPGVYQVKLEKSGFDPAMREVTVTPGENFEVALSLDSNTGGIDLIANPPGMTVYLDGNVVGTTEPDPDPQLKRVSKVFQLRNLSMGEHTIMVAHKRAVPNRRSIKVSVEKGQIERLPPLNMWIPDSLLKLKNGRQYTGRVLNTNDKGDDVVFEPEVGVRISYKRTEIISIEPLSLND